MRLLFVRPFLLLMHGGLLTAIAWIGHATMLTQFGGLNRIPDAMFSQRASPFQWLGPHRALTPVQRGSGRTLADRPATPWGGFAVLAPDLQFSCSGDTGCSKGFSDFSDFYIAPIPIGAREPRWFMADQHARRPVSLHWGTFALADDSLDEPPRALAEARRAQGLADDAFIVLALGQTRTLARRGT